MCNVVITVVHNDNFILGWTIPLIQALQQNHINTVIYWSMLLDTAVA